MTLEAIEVNNITKPAKRFVVLDGLRGVAAIAVVFGHTYGKNSWGQFNGLGLATSVPFFFVLSGFVLAFSYPELGTLNEIFRFLLQRIIRLFPLILFAAAIGSINLILRFSSGQFSQTDLIFGIISAITTIPSPSLGIDSWRWPANYPEWSLFFELLASLAFALFLVRMHTVGLVAVLVSAARVWSLCSIDPAFRLVCLEPPP